MITAGDVSSNGFVDLAVGAWGYDNSRGRVYLYYGPIFSKTNITFNWDTSNANPGKHSLTATVSQVAGEEDVIDNTVTVAVDVKEIK
jgi:hypothetical protein